MRRYVFMAVSALISGAMSYAVFLPRFTQGGFPLWLIAAAGAGTSIVLDFSRFWNSSNSGDWQGWRGWFNISVALLYTGALAALMLQVHWTPLIYAFYLPAATFLGWLVVAVIRRVFGL